MKVIKIIDLLNMISKGEEVPKKIKFDNTYWNRICGEKYPYYTNDYDSNLFIYFFRKNLTFSLNDEVEIIEEEHKIPDKIFLNQDYGSCYIDPYSYKQVPLKREKLSPEEVSIINKINEILDYLEEIE